MHLMHDDWEVVDLKHVPQVPVYYDESLVHITAIFEDDMVYTYTFDSPSASSSSRRASFRSLLRSPKSPQISLSPSPSPTFSDDYEDSFSLSSMRDPRDFTPAQARDALISARSQLLSSSNMRKMGANVLFTEGWLITKLRKGSRYRLQVQYTARPAKATTVSQDALLGLPPFMDILEGSW